MDRDPDFTALLACPTQRALREYGSEIGWSHVALTPEDVERAERLAGA